MNIELSTENLHKLCRVCLNGGDYNLCEHRVNVGQISTSAVQDVQDLAEEEKELPNEVTAHEMLQMYSEWEYTVLQLDSELPLICKSCLDELLSSYKYYRKLLAASKQLHQLYEEAQLMENIECDEPQPAEELQTYVDIAVDTQCTGGSEEVAPVPFMPLPPTFPSQEACKRKIIKNPKIVLTGGVTQLLTHVSEKSQLPSFEREPARKRSFETTTTDVHKRQRKQEPAAAELLENAALVIPQFVPTASVPMRHENAASADSLPDEEGSLSAVTPSELRTMDYAAVEIKSDSIKALENEKDSEEAFALSMASALKTDVNGRAIYVCKYCPQAFSTPYFLITHARKSHVCKYCTQAYEKTVDLYAHIRKEHARRHKCVICGKELSSHSNLRAHIKRMHGIKLPAQVSILSYRSLENRTDETVDCAREWEALVCKKMFTEDYDDAESLTEESTTKGKVG